MARSEFAPSDAIRGFDFQARDKASVFKLWSSSQDLRVSSAQQHECTSIYCPHVVIIRQALFIFRPPLSMNHTCMCELLTT